VPTYNRHQNTDIVLYLFNFTFSTITNQLAQSAGLPRVTGSNLTADRNFFIPKIILKIYSKDFENVKIYFFEKKI
jgi:hypothetical protein